MSAHDALSDLGDRAQAKVESELAGVKAKHPSSDGLRKLADWLDSAAAAKVNVGTFGIRDFQIDCFPDNNAETVRIVAKQMRAFDKDYTDDLMTLTKDFGGVSLRAVFLRSTACKRVVVGTVEIPERVIPAVQAKPEAVIPAQTVEKVEWQCEGSLLADAFEQIGAAS